ncbi:unnamed protein product [Prunus armeniaca]
MSKIMALLRPPKENTPPRPDPVEPPPPMIESSLYSIVSDYEDWEYFICMMSALKGRKGILCLGIKRIQSDHYFSDMLAADVKIHEDWCCFVKHIFREQNCAADALAVKSYDFALGLQVFLEAPAFLSDMLATDV